MAQDFVIINKTTTELSIQQKYVPLPVLQGAHPLFSDAVLLLATNDEVVVKATRPVDVHYERQVIVSRILDTTTHTLVHDLVAEDEDLIVFPVPYAPFLSVTKKSHFWYSLVRSSALGSVEATLICQQENEMLEYASTFLRAAGTIRKDTVAVASVVEDTFCSIRASVGSLFTHTNPPLVAEVLPHLAAPITGDQIHVRFHNDGSDGLCKAEEEARDKRFAHIRNVLQLPDESVRPPCISLVTSGGGMRAVISTIGFLIALKEMGVLDIATYMASLSGSSWAASKWMDSENNPFVSYSGAHGSDGWSSHVPAQAHEAANLDGLIGMVDSPISLSERMDILWQIIKHGNLMNGYAELLGTKLGTSDVSKYKTMAEKSSTGLYPIPIYSTCFPDATNTLQWSEFTPFEIGSTFLGTFFSMDQLVLDGAASTPPTLAELMAVWGSAYDATVARMFETEDVNLDPVWNKIFGKVVLKGNGIVNPNYNRLDPKTGKPMPLANQKKIFLRDAGIQAALPVPALLLRPERNVDLLIVLDVTGDVKEIPFRGLKESIPSLKVPTVCEFPYVFPKTDDHPQII